MDLGLRDKVYLVTGGSRGLGFAAAQALVADGARVVLSAREEASASAAAALLAQHAFAGGRGPAESTQRSAATPAAVGAAGGAAASTGAGTAGAGAGTVARTDAGPVAGAATWVAADNADPATPGRLIAAARGRFGRLDGALISVGGPPAGTVTATTDDAWRSAFESVFLGAVRLARVLAPELDGESDGRDGGAMTGRGGSIVFVLSSSVRVPITQLAISNGLRPGLAGVVKTLANELGPAGIRVNGLMPARIATGRVDELDALTGDADEARARQSQQIPLRRYGEPDEFGRVAAFLLAPAASYITGAMIPVDGGAIRSI